MGKSKFKEDIANEDVVKNLIVSILNELDSVDAVIKSDKSQDLLGSDIQIKSKSIFKDDNEHHIDIKSATNYRRTIEKDSISTFAFELQYRKDGELKEGWLYGSQYSLTEYYLFSWLWVYDDSKTKGKILKSDIARVELVLVKKSQIHDYLSDNFGITSTNYKTLIRNFNNHIHQFLNDKDCEYAVKLVLDGDKVTRAELSLSSPKENVKYVTKNGEYEKVLLPKIMYSGQLNEEPYNILIEKERLIELSKEGGFHEVIDIK